MRCAFFVTSRDLFVSHTSEALTFDNPTKHRITFRGAWDTTYVGYDVYHHFVHSPYHSPGVAILLELDRVSYAASHLET